MNEWLLNLFQVLYILKMVQMVLVLGILLSMIQIDLTIGYHVISVIPSPEVPCNETELQCLTLSQLANSSSDYIGANTTLHFLPGEHSLDSTLLIKNSDSLNASSLDSNVTIACSHSSARFEFRNISVVHISGLTFTGCTGNKFVNINQLTLEDSKFIGNKDSNINGPALELIESSAKLIRTELSHYYGSRVTPLLCENGDDWDARYDFLFNRRQNRNDNIAVSATAGGASIAMLPSMVVCLKETVLKLEEPYLQSNRTKSQSSTAHSWGIRLQLYNHISTAILVEEFYIPMMVVRSQFITVHLNVTQHTGLEVSWQPVSIVVSSLLSLLLTVTLSAIPQTILVECWV